jgi:hypothetical protein
LHDPKLWAHEITHVVQYARWGVDEFAVRYLRDYQAVEKEAWDFRWQWMKDKNLIPAPAGQKPGEPGAGAAFVREPNAAAGVSRETMPCLGHDAGPAHRTGAVLERHGGTG